MPSPVAAETLEPVRTDIADNGDVLLDELRAIEQRRALLAASDGTPRPASAPAHAPDTPLNKKLETFVTKAADLDLSALCLSGGGIRSAAFALGVVQGLAARKILRRFDYLSTVSGGGYTGAMLTAWVQRAGYDNVEKDLVGHPKSHATISPLQHLRRYSSYLSPSAGLLSTDMLALVALYVRNLLLNWFVLIPILMAVIIALKWVTQWAWTFEAGATEVAMFGLLAVALAGTSMVDSLQQRPGWGDESSSRSRFLVLELLPTLVAGVLISVAALKIYQQSVARADVAGGSWLLKLLTGLQWYGNVAVVAAGTYFVAAVLALSFSPPRAGKDNDKSTSENIRTRDLYKGVLHRGILIVLALTASGAVVGLLLARIIDAIGAPSPGAADGAVSPVKVFLLMCLGPSVFMTAVFLAELLYCALTGKVSWGDAEREWLGRAAGYHARAAVFWSLAFAVVYLGSYGINHLYRESVTSLSGLLASGGIAGVVASLVGKSSSTMAVFKKGYATLASRSLNVVLAVAATAFIIILTSVLSTAVDWLVLPERKALWFDEKHAVLWQLFWVLFWTALVGAVASWFVNTNRFSLHGVYRNRLIRTFLGASKENRKPNAFTDFYEKDNLNLSDLWPNSTPGGKEKIPPQYLVQNIAMNIIATRELAWQERKAMSFVVTPWWCGCGDQNRESQVLRADLAGASGCYRHSEKYGGGISVGTSMAISGAAASPNMGYHSSPALSLLLTFFNVRLGAWLGNPNSAGNSTWRHAGPRIAGWPMIQEALGLTDGTKEYVYLSDGGHFDNLGLYEMVRRRCRLIIISDAGCDPDFGFEDLGNACRKISIDQDIDIEFEALKMVARKTPPVEGPYFAVARIKYRDPGAKEGILVYIKPNFQGIEPISVRSYALKATLFPHESTADQFFGESQFEAYRALGRFAIDHIDGAPGKTYPDVNAFVTEIRTNAAKAAAPAAGSPTAAADASGRVGFRAAAGPDAAP